MKNITALIKKWRPMDLSREFAGQLTVPSGRCVGNGGGHRAPGTSRRPAAVLGGDCHTAVVHSSELRSKSTAEQLLPMGKAGEDRFQEGAQRRLCFGSLPGR